MSIDQLARPEIARLQAYVTAEQQPDTVRLNANEAPYSPTLENSELNRYPQIRPDAIIERLAGLYGVTMEHVMVTRGSSEAIDILIRSFCRAYTDNIVTTTPSFAMYRVYAEMQAAEIVQVPLSLERDFALDTEKLLAACTDNSKLIFLCSPNNPSGDLLNNDSILQIAKARAGRSVVVVDEAYIEFSERPSLLSALNDYDNLIILRTLSKAYGLAGLRCGSIIAPTATIRLLSAMLPPYAFSSPTTERVLDALASESIAAANALVATTIEERERVRAELETLNSVVKVWPSQSNFLLVRFRDLAAANQALSKVKVLIRSFANDELLNNCARITIGAAAENDLLIKTLKTLTESET
ncbi:MAG: histidinol-phosphate transaminase [Woeseia sp.]